MPDPTAEDFRTWARQSRADMGDVLGLPHKQVTNIDGVANLMHQRYRGKSRAEVKATFAAQHAPPPEPDTPGDVPDLDPVPVGDWRGHFLVGRTSGAEQGLYFAPSCVTWPADRRARLFRWYTDNGYTHCLINAEQRHWGPLVHPPDPTYTQGAPFSAHDDSASLNRLVKVLVEANQAGLVPVLGVFEQAPMRDRPITTLIAQAERLADATWPLVSLYWLSWEYTYVLQASAIRRPVEDRLLGDVDWHGRPVGLHYQPAMGPDQIAPGTTLDTYPHDYGLSGGITRYQEMTNIYPHVTRLMQYHRESPEWLIRLQTQACMVVHGWGPGQHRLGGFICAEISAGIRLSSHTPEQIAERRGWVMDEVRKAQMPERLSGYLN